VTHGKPALLREEVGLTGDAVASRVLNAMGFSAQPESGMPEPGGLGAGRSGPS
jgi:hypothetical protein